MKLPTAAFAADAPGGVSFDDALDMFDDNTPPQEENTADASKTAVAEGDEDNLDADAQVAVSDLDENAPAIAGEFNDTTVIPFDDGTQVKLADLREAYQSRAVAHAETTRVLQEVARERGNLHILGTNLAQALENISNYLVQRLPPEPHPQLAYTDPGEHYRQKILREDSIAELNDMLSVAEGAREAVAMLTEAEFLAFKAQEDQRWITMMPSLKDPKRFAAADAKAKNHALALGWPRNEVDTTAKAELRKVFFQSARYEEIMANTAKAKGKVENASVLPPTKARQHVNSVNALTQVNAKKALAKSGRLEDALKINF